jgi:hypothetical protein
MPPGAEPPGGVVLHAPDGTAIDCAVRYIGRDSDGITIWRAVPVSPLPPLPGTWTLTCQSLPARTRLTIDGPRTAGLTIDGPEEQS